MNTTRGCGSGDEFVGAASHVSANVIPHNAQGIDDMAAEVTTKPDSPVHAEHRALRTALGTFPTGVTIITAAGNRGTPVGLTVNSFSSVSLDPPMLSWSLRRTSPLLDYFAVGRRCAIHVLRVEQERLARNFATPGIDRFAAVAWRADHDGLPILAGALARFECRTEIIHEAGDHWLLLVRIERHTAEEGVPLLFANGRFRAL